MCGRFAQHEPLSLITKTFFIDEIMTDVPPGYNIAPGTQILSIISRNDKKLLVDFKWGLVPHWAKDPAMGNKMINARGETVHEKPGFRNAFKSRRCLITASGYYEWMKGESGKRPVYIRLKSGGSITFAGLYETWASPEGSKLSTCTIITTEPNELLEPVHHPMPVIIAPHYHDLWLKNDNVSLPEIPALLSPYPSDEMEWYEVSKFVNSPANDSPGCIEPV